MVNCPGYLEKCLAHRHASDLRIAEIFRRLLEVNRRARNPPRHQAIGKTGHNIRLERQGWSSLQDGRQHGWAGSVPANSDHDVRLKFREHAARIPDRAGKIEQSLQPRFETDFVERADLDKPQRKSGRRNQPVLDAARRTDEQHFGGISLLQFMGNGKRRDHVSAGAAACQNCPHGLTINRKLRCGRAAGLTL